MRAKEEGMALGAERIPELQLVRDMLERWRGPVSAGVGRQEASQFCSEGGRAGLAPHAFCFRKFCPEMLLGRTRSQNGWL